MSDEVRARRDRAWLLLIGLLAGLVTVVGGLEPAGASTPPPACAAGAEGQQVTLPSGATQTFCYGEVTTSAAAPAITLDKTVGTDPEACATDDAIEVVPGTEVTYCYTATNTGDVTASVHDLEDDQLGTLLSGYTYELGPGASTFVTASATIDADTVNVATWTASDGITPAQGVDTATVTVASVPGAPTIGGATATEGRAELWWSGPGTDGGSPVTGFVVTPYLDAVAGTPVVVGPTESSTAVDGLANGQTYTFTVAATNAVGTGPESVASGEVTPQWWLPWSSGTVAVTELFTWMRGTPPTATELSDWLAQLNSGAKLPGDLVAALRVTPDALANVDTVTRLYSAYFLRIPDKGGFDYWIAKRRAGWSLTRISDYFAKSTEFNTTYGSLTNRQFVEQVYLNVLGRPGDQPGIDYWTAQIDTGKRTRGNVMLNFSDSAEYKAKVANAVDAEVIYLTVLGRAPISVVVDGFVADRLSGATLAEVAREILHSWDLRSRAG